MRTLFSHIILWFSPCCFFFFQLFPLFFICLARLLLISESFFFLIWFIIYLTSEFFFLFVCFSVNREAFYLWCAWLSCLTAVTFFKAVFCFVCYCFRLFPFSIVSCIYISSARFCFFFPPESCAFLWVTKPLGEPNWLSTVSFLRRGDRLSFALTLQHTYIKCFILTKRERKRNRATRGSYLCYHYCYLKLLSCVTCAALFLFLPSFAHLLLFQDFAGLCVCILVLWHFVSKLVFKSSRSFLVFIVFVNRLPSKTRSAFLVLQLLFPVFFFFF